MKLILLILNIIFFTPIYCQNLDYKKYHSSNNLDLSYKVYLDDRSLSNTDPYFSSNEDRENRLFNSSKEIGQYCHADVGNGNYAYQKKTGEWEVFSSTYQLDYKKAGYVRKVKTGVWNYYYNGKLKEKSNYFKGDRQGPTYLYFDNGKVSDTLFYDCDYVDGMLNLDKMSNYMEYLRDEIKYSTKYSSKFSNGEWIETSSNRYENEIEMQYVGKKNANNKRNGIWKKYIVNGNQKALVQIINYTNGVRQGVSISYYGTGEVKDIQNYENGVVSGELTSYYRNGKVSFIANCKDNLFVGKIIKIGADGYGEVYYKGVYDDGGPVTDPVILLRIKNFKNPNTIEDLMSIKNEEVKNSITVNKPKEEVKNITTTNKTPESEDDTVYNSMGLDKRPSFIGGNGDLDSYVNETFNNKNLSGKIFVSFVIEKDGNLSSLKVDRDLGEGSGDEVVRILNLCKNCWSPAEIKGKKVRCYYSTAITINK
jgi:antitoxin component YwqK of YwqJK toxin-antitoxin module